MLSLKFDGTLKLVQDAPVPRREGEALVRVLAAGICNTDIEITRGYARFRGTPGHEFVGVVEEAPDESLVGRRVVGEINAGCGHCADCRAGDPRHCRERTVLGIVNRDGAFAEYLSLPGNNLLMVPDSISDEAAVFTEPLAAACGILERVTIRQGDRVAIVGDGKLGLLIAQVLRLATSDLTLIGRHEEKLEIARRHGIKTGLAEELKSGQFDYVVEASGSSQAMALALDLVRPRGTIVLKSTYADHLTVDASRIVVNEISVVGSRCGRFRDALELLKDDKVDLRSMVTQIFPLTHALQAFDYAQQPGVLKVILKP
jgi:threonine dehydrogenase-like Zn-dependent dehydrogenase